MRDPGLEARRGRGQAPLDGRSRLGRGDLCRRGQATVRAVVRPAARLIVLTSDGSILLQRFSSGGRSWWVCPGGGLEGDETAEQGAIREAHEELGLDISEIGPEVWRRRHVFEWAGRLLDQRERFFVLVVTERFEPRPAIGAERLEAEGVREQRWWTTEEIETHTEAEFAPKEIVELVRSLIAEGPPPQPIDAGV